MRTPPGHLAARKLLKNRRQPTMRKGETKARRLLVEPDKKKICFEAPEGLYAGQHRLAFWASDNFHALQRYLPWDELTVELVID